MYGGVGGGGVGADGCVDTGGGSGIQAVVELPDKLFLIH